MKKYKKMIVFEPIQFLSNEGRTGLLEFCDDIEFVQDQMDGESDVAKAIGSADCIILPTHPKVTNVVLDLCPNLRYIGMACSFYDVKSSNLDVGYCDRKGIEYSFLKDYGDEVGEAIVGQVISLCRGLGDKQYREQPVELCNCTVGIVGMGTTGLNTAKRFLGLGCKVSYYSRSLVQDAKNLGIDCMPLDSLLKACDIISVHLPRDVILFDRERLKALGDNKILVNCGIGVPYRQDEFVEWLNGYNNWYICDKGIETANVPKVQKHIRTYKTDKWFGCTIEAVHRATTQIIKSLKRSQSQQTNVGF